jgi:hypothetical protein
MYDEKDFLHIILLEFMTNSFGIVALLLIAPAIISVRVG